jgi:hypothetical protein
MNNRPPSVSKGQKCTVCGHQNRPGVLICENCGSSLVTGQPFIIDTRTFEEKEKAPLPAEVKQQHDTLREKEGEKSSTGPLDAKPLDTEEVRAIRSAGTAEFTDEMVLRLEVEGAQTPILITPTIETILGRRDPVTGGAPEVDLTSYAGYRMGVSRRHAMLRLRSKTLDILDLGSANGTYVNGVKLGAHQPHAIRDGDEISLGKMVLRVFFQSSKRR